MAYITRLGKPITLDPEGCAKFGFIANQRIFHPTGGHGMVIGTALEHGTSGRELIWCTYDRSKTPNVVLNSQKPELLQTVH